MEYIKKSELLSRILDMIDKQHKRIDSQAIVTQATKDKADGYLEALYQVENVILNFGNENEAIKQTL